MAVQRINTGRLEPKPEGSPPDSTEPFGLCPRCDRHSNFTLAGHAPVSYTSTYVQNRDGDQGRDFDQRLSVLTCQGCSQNVIVVEDEYIGGVARRAGGRSGANEWRGIHWWPTPGGAPRDASLPGNVADAISEGERCLAVLAPRAAVVMFRAALALIVTDKGSPTARAKSNLAGQLQQMSQDGDLDRTLSDWASHIRLVGNSGAHPGTLDPVSAEEAQDLSRLMASLVEYLYVMPARVARARSKP